MNSGIRNVLIGFGVSMFTIIVTGSNLSFDKLNTNFILLSIFIIAFAYQVYFFVFVTIMYNEKISKYTTQIIQNRIKNSITCFKKRKCVLKLGDISVLTTFLTLGIITTSPPDTVLQFVPGGEFLTLLINSLSNYFFQTTFDVNTSKEVPYISSIVYLMLAAIGPIMIFSLRLRHVLELERIDKNTKKENQKKKHSSKNSEEEIQPKFQGVRILTFFIIIAPVILIINRILSPNPILYDFTLLSIAMLSGISWFYAWVMRTFESTLFSKLP